LGLFAVVPHELPSPAANQQEVVQPGVIFCLRQKREPATVSPEKVHRTVNPLSPIFLVYVYKDGTVKYNFAHARQILDVFRLLCAEITIPYGELCVLFQQETNQGKNMDAYDRLMRSALTSIKGTFADRNVQNLMNNRSGVLIPDCESPSSDDGQSEFELITWLIIK
jgi:hypothetical protein